MRPATRVKVGDVLVYKANGRAAHIDGLTVRVDHVRDSLGAQLFNSKVLVNSGWIGDRCDGVNTHCWYILYSAGGFAEWARTKGK